jgi:glycosyltransferase involved in cell wall biosynthesis
VAYGVPVQPSRNRGWRRKLAWVLNPRVEYPHGGGVDRESMERVLRTAAQFDVVWFCKLRTPNMFPRWAWTRSVVDVDDVPSTYEQSVQRVAIRPRERLLTAVRVFSWRRRDKLLGDRFSVLGVCSEADKRYLEGLGVQAPIYVIPNGFEGPSETAVRNPATPPRIGFIGIFDYEPNLAGIKWFTSECWPRIKREVPDARLRLVGRHSDGPRAPAGPDIDGLGWVANAAEEMATWSAMIVPILVGAGTRGKIAHAFSLRCPVVSTSLGAYGYEATDGREMFLADSPEDFSSACVRAMQRPREAAEMAERAWQQFLEKWSWDAIRPRVWAAAEHCLRLTADTS